MFTPERKNVKIERNNITPMKDITFKSALNEGTIDFERTMDGYHKMIESSLDQSNYVYNEYVQYNMKDYCIILLTNAIKIIEDSINILTMLKYAFIEEMSYLKSVNKKVIETYEPLLKRLNCSNYTFQVPQYTLNNLQTEDIYNRVISLINTKFNLNMFTPSTLDYEQVESAIKTYSQNNNIYYEYLKRTILGVANSYDISDFIGSIQSFLVNYNNLQTKSIDDKFFDDFGNIFIDTDGIDQVITLLQREQFDLYTYRTNISQEDDNHYTTSVYTNAIVIRTNLIAVCLETIEKIIKMKMHIFEDMCINYRKVIIDAYQKISSDYQNINGIYNPTKDSGITDSYPNYLVMRSSSVQE